MNKKINDINTEIIRISSIKQNLSDYNLYLEYENLLQIAYIDFEYGYKFTCIRIESDKNKKLIPCSLCKSLIEKIIIILLTIIDLYKDFNSHNSIEKRYRNMLDQYVQFSKNTRPCVLDHENSLYYQLLYN